MSRNQGNKNLYEYLEPFLEAGNEDDIANARKTYWSKYKAEWRRRRRQEQKEFTISFTVKELQVLKSATDKHNRSYTRYIKEATLAYSLKLFLIPDVKTVNEIRGLLALNYNVFQQLTDEEKLNSATGMEAMQRIVDMETLVLSSLEQPKSLEQWLKKLVESSPDSKTKIIELLETAHP